jgi:hypothetical protein
LRSSSLAFVVAGVVALQATSRLSCWQYPDDLTRFVDLKTLSVAEARIARAVALLSAYGQNANLASWKIKRTTLAARWFRGALLLLLGFAVLFVFYVVDVR